MAIEEFGRSLLSQVHEQRRRQRKKRESYEKKAAIASVVVPVGVRAIENVIQSKAANFLASEQMMARKNKVENAIEIGDFYEDQERKIQTSNLPGIQYFVSDITPKWEALAGREIPEELQGKGAYDAIVNKQVLELATREYEKHQQGLALARRMGSVEDYQTLSALNTKDVRPTNIIDLVGRQVSTVFGGKSTQEREQDAIAAIENSNIFTTAESLNTLRETYDRTKSLSASYSYAQFIENIRGVDKSQFAPQLEQEFLTIGNKIYTRSKEMTWNADAEMWETSYVKSPDGKPVITEIKDLTDPNDKLRANQAVFNFGTQPRLHLNTDGISAWHNKIKEYNDAHKEDDDYLPLNPNLYADGEKGIEQYGLLAGIFQDVIKEPENVKTDRDTFLLLSQLFTQLIDETTVEDLTGDLGQALDDLAASRDPDDPRYGLESYALVPETIGSGEEKKYAVTGANIETFENIVLEKQQALFTYYGEVAEKSRQISEGLTAAGVLTNPNIPDLGVLTPGNEISTDSDPYGTYTRGLTETVGRRADITRDSDVYTMATQYQNIQKRYEEGEITQEEWENFLENGELPKP
jgi:ribosomal protein S8E